MLLGILFTLPPVQTFVGRIVTKELKKSTGADISVGKVAVTVFGSVKLKEVLIRDHHNDTLIYASRIQTRIIGKRKLINNGDLIFGNLRADNLTFYLTTYKGEEDSNINIFVEKLENDKPKSNKPFVLTAVNLRVTNGRFVVTNHNKQKPVSVDFKKVNVDFDNFSIHRDVITAESKYFSFLFNDGVFMENLKGRLKYSNNQIHILNLDAQSKEGSLLTGAIVLNYQKGDLAEFTDRVVMDVLFEKGSKLATNDLNYFYPEFAENRIWDFSTKASGTLNDFLADDLWVYDENMLLNANLAFKNITVAGEREFSISGDITEIYTSNKELKEMMPRVLGVKLPDVLDSPGRISLNGNIYLDRHNLNLKSNIRTQIGNLTTDFQMHDITNPTNTSYQGTVTANNFHLGKLLKQNILGRATGTVDIKGKGFTLESVDNVVKGKLQKFDFNGYHYQNILIGGSMTKPEFRGEVHIDDPNVKLSFEGMAALSASVKKYDLKAQIDYADLNVLQLVTRDTLSVIKGNIHVEAEGNTLDEMAGRLNFRNTSYQNHNDIYYFEDFTVTSEFNERKIRTIAINSPDIIEGVFIGRYHFKELGKIFENALGSLYTNYSPHKIEENQFVRFNFSIYNKIIEVFYPNISLGSNTIIRGHLNPDEEVFKLNFITPTLEIGENRIDQINLQIDNKNPLYNAYVEIDSIRTPLYKISDFGLINVSHNDTLYFRTEFKGGDKNQDYYNLNLYHTINEDNNSVVGFQKSELFFKDFLWFLNEENNQDNKVVFNKSIRDFTIEKIKLSHEDKSVDLFGEVRDTTYKDIHLDFKDVPLAKVMPTIDKVELDGILNGTIHFEQDHDIYKPTSSLEVLGFSINQTVMGDLLVEAEGDQNLRKFGINSYLYKDEQEYFSAEGDLEIINKETFANFDLRLTNFNIAPFSNFGGEVITNIRGLASGRTTIIGNLKKPEINGRVYLNKAGMKIPYLNTDYAFEENTIVDVTQKQIFLRQTQLTDTKYQTKSAFFGTINHKMFSDWILDLNLSSSRFLVLDTEDSDDALYYGTAFIKGTASINGPATGLTITANATSEKGTHIKIPIGSSKSVGEVSYIQFTTPNEKYNLNVSSDTGLISTGLEMNFNLNVTPDAEIDIIIDKNTGHAIRRGKGNGTLFMDINTLGRFTMNGVFTVEDGYYDFRYGGIINKRFDVKRGGTITWSGDPILANLNVQGVYSTEANPAVLLDNPNFNRKIPVNLVIDVRGTLESLEEPDYIFEFPSVGSSLQSEIQYKLADKDSRRTQALSLLLSRNFMGSDGMGGVGGTFAETGSNLLNNLLSDEGSVFQLGVDYQTGIRNPNQEFQDSDRLGISLSTQISEDITINGRLGVPVGGTEESVVVGNVEMRLRLNEDRTLELRVFNRENDVNYFGEGIGYTQGIGLSWQVDFDTFKQFLNKLFVTETRRKKQNKEQYLDIDSDFTPDYIRFMRERGKQRNKNQTDEVPEEERVPDPF